MDKRASLLMITFLCGLLLGVFGGAIPQLLIPADNNFSACNAAPCFLYAEFLSALPAIIICGGALAFATLLLAKALHRLFYEKSP